MANSLNTITVGGVTYDAATYNKTLQASQKSSSTDNSVLGKDAFLQLLVKQLEYQDPLDPQDNSQYLSQLAQFSSLEQMNNVATNMSKLAQIVNNIDTSVLVGQLSSMIGKEVQWSSTETITDSTGKATVDANGNVQKRTVNYKGTVQGVNIVDGVPKIVAQADGKTHEVEISAVSSVMGK